VAVAYLNDTPTGIRYTNSKDATQPPLDEQILAVAAQQFFHRSEDNRLSHW
jgi:hypothetical protein